MNQGRFVEEKNYLHCYSPLHDWRSKGQRCFFDSFKAALNRAAESLALNMAKSHIRVKSVAPSAIAVRGDLTPEALSAEDWSRRIPLGRKGTPRELGYPVRYIASDQAAYMTSNTVKLDDSLILLGAPES